jgi:hypothetical protein
MIRRIILTILSLGFCSGFWGATEPKEQSVVYSVAKDPIWVEGDNELWVEPDGRSFELHPSQPMCYSATDPYESYVPCTNEQRLESEDEQRLEADSAESHQRIAKDTRMRTL